MKKIAALFFVTLALVSAVPAFAEEVSTDKLNQILEKQDRILKELAEIKAELEIVKVRATIR